MGLAKEVDHSALSADYDRGADVLYIAIGEPRPSEGEGRERGIVVRYPFDDPDHARGVTVVGYRAHGWPKSFGQLADQISQILHVNRRAAADAIRKAVNLP